MQRFLILVRMRFIRKKRKANLKRNLGFNKQGSQPSKTGRTRRDGCGQGRAIHCEPFSKSVQSGVVGYLASEDWGQSRTKKPFKERHRMPEKGQMYPGTQSYRIRSQGAARDECCCLIGFSLPPSPFIQFWVPVHGTVLPTLRVAVPFSIQSSVETSSQPRLEVCLLADFKSDEG